MIIRVQLPRQTELARIVQAVNPLRLGLGFLVIGVIRRALVAAGARAQSFDAKLIHHVLMVLFRGPLLGGKLLGGVRRGGRRFLTGRRSGTGQKEHQGHRPSERTDQRGKHGHFLGV
jgi:hypothetical protein